MATVLGLRRRKRWPTFLSALRSAPYGRPSSWRRAVPVSRRYDGIASTVPALVLRRSKPVGKGTVHCGPIGSAATPTAACRLNAKRRSWRSWRDPRAVMPRQLKIRPLNRASRGTETPPTDLCGEPSEPTVEAIERSKFLARRLIWRQPWPRQGGVATGGSRYEPALGAAAGR